MITGASVLGAQLDATLDLWHSDDLEDCGMGGVIWVPGTTYSKEVARSGPLLLVSETSDNQQTPRQH